VDSNSLKKGYEDLMTRLTANNVQIAGTHYSEKSIQPWDYIVANQLGYLEGNIIKYISRYKEKGGIQDLRKAQHYIEKLIEVNTPTVIIEKMGIGD
jgi:hypothetical protein